MTVEFAIVAPLIFLLFLGGLELTALNFTRQTLGNASYEAARKMIIPGGTAAQAQTEGIRQMSLVGITSGVTVTTSQTTANVTVTVSVPAANVSWGLRLFSNGYTLRQSCTLTKE
ncbi:MAG: TadE/TadG family type IV pilus assembly protein [Planctomycetota bacterium]